MNFFDSEFRFPAEWEPVNHVLLAWPHAHTDWAYMLEEVQNCFLDIVEAVCLHGKALIVAPDTGEAQLKIEERGIQKDRFMVLEAETNDTWARDFGPLTVRNFAGEYRYLDFKFNGWGLKFASNHDNLINTSIKKIFSDRLVNRLNFVLEGGSVESDGNGLMLTTSECLLSPNRNGQMSKSEIESYLKTQFGLKKLLWLDYGYLAGDDTDSHIDTLARLAPNDTILYVKSYDPEDEHHSQLQKMEEQLKQFKTLEGNPFNLIGLPLPRPIFYGDERLPATYANYLVLNDAVLLPTYNQKDNDRLATEMLKIAYPDHEIITIDCRPLIRQHGSLHCMTMQIPGLEL